MSFVRLFLPLLLLLLFHFALNMQCVATLLPARTLSPHMCSCVYLPDTPAEITVRARENKQSIARMEVHFTKGDARDVSVKEYALEHKKSGTAIAPGT